MRSLRSLSRFLAMAVLVLLALPAQAAVLRIDLTQVQAVDIHTATTRRLDLVLHVDTDTSAVLDGAARLYSTGLPATALDYSDYDIWDPVLGDLVPAPTPLRRVFEIGLGTDLPPFFYSRYGEIDVDYVSVVFGADGIRGVLDLAPGTSRTYRAIWNSFRSDGTPRLRDVSGSTLTITKLRSVVPGGGVTAVPLPSAALLLLGAVAGLGVLRRHSAAA